MDGRPLVSFLFILLCFLSCYISAMHLPRRTCLDGGWLGQAFFVRMDGRADPMDSRLVGTSHVIFSMILDIFSKRCSSDRE
jgi:hypothetical protein